jgi:hypothetical protein
MTPDWTPLNRELARWRAADLALPLWWRDDDAIEPTPALSRLSDLAARLDMPVHLAVIPAMATTDLADMVADTPQLIPVVHGWAHRNHAPQSEKKAEFGNHRAPEQLAGDAANGMTRLRDLFGPRLARMFVPPWNRIAPAMIAQLPGLGFAALSGFTPRRAAFPVPQLVQINTHLDPINWRAGKTLVAPDTLIAQVTQQLANRRTGAADPLEPYGVLTHHLVHDTAIWAFTEQLFSRLLAGPCHRWTAATTKDTSPT